MPLESLTCPSCGAPLPDPAGRPTVTCTHCHTVVRVAASSPARVPPARPPAPTEDQPYTPAEPIPAKVSAKLIELLRAGRKSEAVEYYQGAASVGEREARDVVDAIQAGLPPTVIPTGTVDLDRIQYLLANRRRTYAIQLYREQAGVTLSDAAKAVDAIAAGREPPPIVPAGDARRLPGEDVAKIRELLKSGKKIEAIKLYRERTGLGLAEAKSAVEAIERGGEPPAAAMARAVHQVPAGVDLAHIQDVLRAGNKIEAIRLYRNFTGLGLKEAKDAVEAIAVSTPGVDPALGPGTDYRGCYNLLLVIAVAVMCLFGGCGTVAQTTATYRCVMTEIKNDPVSQRLLGRNVNAGYLVLSPSYNQSFDFDGSWRLSMNLFMPAWGSEGLGLLYVNAAADDTGYTAMRATLFKDFERHVVRTWETVACP